MLLVHTPFFYVAARLRLLGASFAIALRLRCSGQLSLSCLVTLGLRRSPCLYVFRCSVFVAHLRHSDSVQEKSWPSASYLLPVRRFEITFSMISGVARKYWCSLDRPAFFGLTVITFRTGPRSDPTPLLLSRRPFRPSSFPAFLSLILSSYASPRSFLIGFFSYF